jgi:hypothetical protein
MSDIKDRLAKVEELISDEKFLTNKGVANEVGIHIFQYDPKDEITVRSFFEELKQAQGKPFRFVECDLFEIFLQICDEKHLTKNIEKTEEKRGKDYLLTNIHKAVPVELYVQKMQYEPHEQGDILLITGVGKVYPFMRSHTVLNNIQHMFSDIPVIMLYPGSYDGQSLKLFSKFTDDNYYRAFNLI